MYTLPRTLRQILAHGLANQPINLFSTYRLFYDIVIDMNTVTLSPKFQVVIPLAIRKALKLTPGEKFRVIRYGDRVEFIPVRSASELKGILRGMDTRIERETDRL